MFSATSIPTFLSVRSHDAVREVSLDKAQIFGEKCSRASASMRAVRERVLFYVQSSRLTRWNLIAFVWGA